MSTIMERTVEVKESERGGNGKVLFVDRVKFTVNKQVETWRTRWSCGMRRDRNARPCVILKFEGTKISNMAYPAKRESVIKKL